jgi:hypothetical protein
MNGTNAGPGLFDRSLAAALILGVGGGAVLLMVSTAIVFNWHRWAERYTNVTDAWPGQRWSRANRVRLNRCIFVVFAFFGVGLIAAGLTSAFS